MFKYDNVTRSRRLFRGNTYTSFPINTRCNIYLWYRTFVYILICIPPRIVVTQPYNPEILTEYVIRGNSAILKCSIPSYIAEFVTVEAWIREDEEVYLPEDPAVGQGTTRSFWPFLIILQMSGGKFMRELGWRILASRVNVANSGKTKLVKFWKLFKKWEKWNSS